MTRLLFALVLAFAAWIGWQAVGTQRRRAEHAAAMAAITRQAGADAAAESAAYQALQRATGGGRGVRRMNPVDVPEWVRRIQARRLATPNAAPARDGAADSARIARYAQYTYLDWVAGQNDHKLARWPARTEPLRVWVQGNPGLSGWTPEHRSVARGALGTWDQAALPFHIVATDDSTLADVFVLWSRHFAGSTQRIGETNRITDEHGWIVAATVTLALEEPASTTLQGIGSGSGTSKALDVYTIQNAARHELGHVIGLDHSPDKDDIMAAFAGRQDRLSERDVNSARLLYALSPGWYAGPVSMPTRGRNPYATPSAMPAHPSPTGR